MSPRSVISLASSERTKPPAASSDAHSGERERSSSSPSRVPTIRSMAGPGGSSERRRQRSSPTGLSATRRSIASTPGPPESSFFSSSAEAAATARTVLERSIRATLESSTLPAARATAGSPAPDSIAPESASRVPSSGSLVARCCSFALICTF